jgi:hypothetical protein
MSSKRVPLNTKVRPEIKAVVEKFALKEKRSLNNLAELLLEWAAAKLEEAGSTIVLLETEEDRISRQVAVERKTYERLVRKPAKERKQKTGTSE